MTGLIVSVPDTGWAWQSQAALFTMARLWPAHRTVTYTLPPSRQIRTTLLLVTCDLPPGQGNPAPYPPAILPSMGACGIVGKEQTPSVLQPSSAQ